MKYINRTLEKIVKKTIGNFPVIAITGPRQVGKTTLLEYLSQNMYEKVNYVSLDDLLLRSQANEDPELFLRTHETPLIIDEFQYAPKLLNYIKIKVDEMRKNTLFKNQDSKTLYFLTGSQVFSAMKNITESLAGRIAILDLYGLSSRELNGLEEKIFIPDISLLKEKKKTKKVSTLELFEKIINGSYPELNSNSSLNREVFYQSYIKTYIERDVRDLIKVKDETKFIKFLSSVAARTGYEYNASLIANDIEIDSKTVDEWMSILVNTHLVFLLNSYSNNTVQRVIKRPKIIFMDTGLACFLAGFLTPETLEKSSYSGQIFENYIISEIIKSYTNNGYDAHRHLYYYRDKEKREIDLLIVYNNVIYPVEIKKSANPGREAFKNFKELNYKQILNGKFIFVFDETYDINHKGINGISALILVRLL